MMPAMACGARSASQIRRSSALSSRSTPSRVVICSPASASRTTIPPPPRRARSNVQRLVPLEQDVVGDVDHVADRPHPGLHQPLRHPRGRLPHRHLRDPSEVARAALEILDHDGDLPRDRSVGCHPRLGDFQRQTEVGGELTRHADHAHRVGPVGRDREVEDDVVEPEHLLHVGTQVGGRVEPEDARSDRRRARARAPSTACRRTRRRGSCGVRA